MNWRSRFAQQPIGETHCFYAVISPVWKLRNEVMLVSFLKEDCSFNFTLVQLSSYIIFVYGFIRLSPCFNEDVVIATVSFHCDRSETGSVFNDSYFNGSTFGFISDIKFWKAIY